MSMADGEQRSCLTVTQLHTVRQMDQEGKAAGRAPPEGLLQDSLDAWPLPWISPQHGLDQPLCFWQVRQSLEISPSLPHTQADSHTLILLNIHYWK